jgi:hypothetical protein
MAYTDKMVAQIEAAQPLDLNKAKELASVLGVPYRSVISKAKQMKFVYVAKAKAAKSATVIDKVTKSDLVEQIADLLECKFVALDKANISDLNTLISKIEVLTSALTLAVDVEETAQA